MINRYSSRRESLNDSLLNKKLKNAKSYDRIAGYFSSSILEIAGENIESISGKVRIICNSDLSIEDVKTAKLADDTIRKEWYAYNPEEKLLNCDRLNKLYNLLKSKKLIVKILPNEAFGLIHGKAGVITLEDGTKTSFLGSVNESKTAWMLNYELVWEDNSKESIDWIQEEFDSLWNDSRAVPLSDAVVEDIKRISNRSVIKDVDDWKKENGSSASIAVESPLYRKELGLWNHQKYFIDLAFREHKTSYGARYILADQVGLGKTIQLAMSAQLMGLYGKKPILIIAPKTLLQQWQEELLEKLELPSAIWDSGNWTDENNIKYPNLGPQGIIKCPRKIGLVSEGLIKSKSEICDYLLSKEYECVIVDEVHRARRRNIGAGKENEAPQMNNLYSFLMKLSKKTHSMLLATATPIQLNPIELWDLMNILSQNNDSVLGSLSSNWRKTETRKDGLDIISGKIEKLSFDEDSWNWIKNPFPPKYEDIKLNVLRKLFNINDNSFVVNKSYYDLNIREKNNLKNLINDGFYKNYNPYIRHVVRRERAYLEEKGQLEKININLMGEKDSEALVLTGYMKDAYELAEKFCNLLSKRVLSGGLFKTLLLRRIGSSIEAGKNTGYKLLNAWGENYLDDLIEDEENSVDELNTNDIKNLTPEEFNLLKSFVEALEINKGKDPKYEKVIELLKENNWIEKGVIIFSQYYDTVKSIAEMLSTEFPETPVAIYAGGNRSGVYVDGEFKIKSREEIKTSVKKHELKIMVGTDAASEGLNLQTLGVLINLDLPWNPTKLEQRKGRIQRIGQINTTIDIYNMRYKDSVEDRVHELLSERLKNITDIFGQIPDVLEDIWILMANNEKEEAEKIINSIPKENPFKDRYNNKVEDIDWETCSRILNKEKKINYFREGWD